MNIFNYRKKLESEVTELKATLEKVNAENEVLNKKLAEVEGFEVDKFISIEKHQSELQVKIDDNLKLTQEIEQLKNKMLEFDKQVAETSIHLVASQGQVPIAQAVQENPAVMNEDVLSTLHSLKGAEQRKYWEANQDAIYKQLKNK